MSGTTLVHGGTRLSALAGGLLWIGFGSVLALRPVREVGISFRASHDVLPWLGLGLLLIALALFPFQAAQQARTGRLGSWAYRGLLVGAGLYATGHLVRPLLGGAWEPAVPLGLLTAVLSFFLLGFATWRAQVHPVWAAGLLFVSGVSLLLFNDQYVTAWAAVPFGLAAVLLGAASTRAGG